MLLTSEQRMEVLARYVMYKRAKDEDIALGVSDLGAAVDAMDDWLEAVKEMLNNSSSEAGNSLISYKDKLLLMTWIIQTRVNTQY